MDEQTKSPNLNQSPGMAPNPSSVPNSPSAPTPIQSSSPVPASAPAPDLMQQAPQSSPIMQEPPKKGKVWLWIIIILLLLLLIGGGIVGWAVYKGYKSASVIVDEMKKGQTQEEKAEIKKEVPMVQVEPQETEESIFDKEKEVGMPQSGLLSAVDKDIFAILKNIFGEVKLTFININTEGDGMLIYFVKRSPTKDDFGKVKSELELAGYSGVAGGALDEKTIVISNASKIFNDSGKGVKYKVRLTNLGHASGQKFSVSVDIE